MGTFYLLLTANVLDNHNQYPPQVLAAWNCHTCTPSVYCIILHVKSIKLP